VFRFGHPEVSWIDNRPAALAITATRGADTLHLDVVVGAATATLGATGQRFHQLRGRWTVQGTSGGRAVTDHGEGFFETWSEQ
jgi:hypothetical protein